jgi:hypothetical protein
MTTTQQTAPAPAVEVPPADVAAETPETTAAGKEDGVAAVEAGVAGLALGNAPQPQSELHRACAEGRLEDVRAVLGRGLDALESLGEFKPLFSCCDGGGQGRSRQSGDPTFFFFRATTKAHVLDVSDAIASSCRHFHVH